MHGSRFGGRDAASTLLFLVLLNMLVGCGEPPSSPSAAIGGAGPARTVAATSPVPLAGDALHPFTTVLTGRKSTGGALRVWTADDSLRVRVEAPSQIIALQLHVGRLLADVPQTRKGDPIPGAFRWQAEPGAAEWVMAVALSEFDDPPGAPFVVAAHVDLADGEGMWAGTLPFSGSTWATYTSFALNRPPVAHVTASVTANPMAFTFDGSGSADPDGGALTYSWDFGDGSPAVATPIATHVYAAPGTYTAILTITDELDAADEATATVTPSDPRPDLVITSVRASTEPIVYGQAFHFTVVITNRGSGIARISYPSIIAYAAQANYVYPPSTGWELAPGASQTFTVQPNWGYVFVGSHDWTWTVDPYRYAAEADETNNTYVYRATVVEPPPTSGPPPDLVLTNCVVTPANPTNADQIRFTATLENRGTGDAVFPAGYRGYEMQDGGSYSPISDLAGTTLAAGASRPIQIDWPPYWHTPGSYTPRIVMDPAARLAEADETNNTTSCPVTLTQGPQSDLVITSVQASTEPIVHGQAFQFTVVVTNRGTGVARISYPDVIVYAAQANFVYPPGSGWELAPGASQTFTVQPNWGYISVGTHDWVFSVDPYRAVTELDETNNTFTYRATVVSP